jgi:hypothetical protein
MDSKRLMGVGLRVIKVGSFDELSLNGVADLNFHERAKFFLSLINFTDFHGFKDFIKMIKLLTQAEYGRRIGRTGSRISQLVREGIIVLVNGRVDPSQADQAIQAAIDQSRHLKSEVMRLKNKERSKQLELLNGFNGHNEQRGFSLVEIRQQHEMVKMELTRLKLEIEKGNLIPKEQPLQWLMMTVIAAKNAFWNLPYRLQEELAVISDPKEIFRVLKSSIREILEELGKQLPRAEREEILRDEKEKKEINDIPFQKEETLQQ